VTLLAGVAVLLYLVFQVLRPRVKVWWEEAREGVQVAARPRRYLALVAAPELVSWLAMLGTIAVFLAAYNIPVTFHTLMSVTGGNSIANMTSVTPGGAGVVQGFNALSLRNVTSASNATAYSVAQQLVQTAWSIALAILLLVRAFGWSGGKELLGQSYAQAKQKASDETAERRAKREARREARRSARSAQDGPS
jgi:uncharacterized membrane protein YbhN (UPF0104 family)